MTEGVRFPTFAFITGGAGQADDGIPPQPFETFCYDSALMQARIENFNVVPYTSVLPKELQGKGRYRRSRFKPVHLRPHDVCHQNERNP